MLQVRVLTPAIIQKRFRDLLDGKMNNRILKLSGDVVIRDLVDHIDLQREIGDDGAIKKNKPKTIARKLKKGRGSRSLVDYGNLLKRNTYFKVLLSGKRVKIRRKANSVKNDKGTVDYNFVGAILQRRGYRWWGISPTARKTLLQRYLQLLRAMLRRA